MKIYITIQEVHKMLKDKFGEAEFEIEMIDNSKPEPKPTTIISLSDKGITKEEIKEK